MIYILLPILFLCNILLSVYISRYYERKKINRQSEFMIDFYSNLKKTNKK